MPTKFSAVKSVLLILTAGSLLVAGCQSTTPSTPAVKTGNSLGNPPGNTPVTSPGSDRPSPEPAAGDKDLGFRPNPNGFAFENGSGTPFSPKDASTQYLTVKDMQSMFGDKQVCTGSTGGAICVPSPAARKWQTKINSSMNDGQCEGMAVLALLLFKGKEQAGSLEAGKAKAFDLSYDGPVRTQIGKYFAYQYTENVTKATVKGTPSDVLNQLATYLKADHPDPVTLGFYGSSGGHATTPYGIADKGNGIFHILMYDNNWPNQERYIEVDTKANTWIYNFAATNPAEPADAWRGDAESKTLEFTPLSARLSQAKCPYCQTQAASSGSRQIFLNAGTSGNAHIKVVDKNDPSKFIGWDPVSKKYVNRLSGGELVYDKSVFKKGDRPVAPMLQVPTGVNYEIKVDGQDLKSAEQVSVSVFGEGKSLEVSNIDLDPNQQDSLALPADGDSIKYKPGNSPDAESPVISLGYDNPAGHDFAFEVKSLQAGNGEELSTDLVDGKLKVGDTGGTADPYDLAMQRFDEEGDEEDYSKDDIELGAGETDDIDFSHWGGQGQGMLIGPDGQATEEPDVDADYND